MSKGYWGNFINKVMPAVRFTHPPHPTDGNPVIGDGGAGTNTTDTYRHREPNHQNAVLNAGTEVPPIDYRYQDTISPEAMYSQMSDRYREPDAGRYQTPPQKEDVTPNPLEDSDFNYPNREQFGIRPPSQYRQQYTPTTPKSADFTYFKADQDEPIGGRSNVHSEPVMTVINSFNELASALKLNLSNLFDAGLDVSRVNNLLTLSRYALAAHAAAADYDLADSEEPTELEQLDGGNPPHPNDVTASALHNFNECLRESIEIIELADQISPSMENAVAYLDELTKQLYEEIYSASLQLQRCGDRYDQFVINISSPDELFPDTYGSIDNRELLPPALAQEALMDKENFSDSIPDFDQQAFAESLIPDDLPMSGNVTDALLAQAADAVATTKYSPPDTLEDAMSFNSIKSANFPSYRIEIIDFRPVVRPATVKSISTVKHGLSLRQLINAFNIAYTRIMASGGGFIYTSTPISGLARIEIDALAEEGLLNVVGNKMTLSRMGYDRVQWLNATNLAASKPVTSPSLTSKKPNTLY